MFQLTQAEYVNLISQSVISRWGGRRKLPFAFTEHGIIMLSSVLNSKIANQINKAVVKAFIEMRRYITKEENRFYYRAMTFRFFKNNSVFLYILTAVGA